MKAKVIKTGEIVDVYHEPQHGQVSNIYKESVLINGRMWSEEELDFFVKANKAPEKIYLNPIQYALTELLSTKVKGDIEYIRKDALIEKACELLARMIWEVTYEDLEGNSVQHYDKMEFIEEFRNYMKGE